MLIKLDRFFGVAPKVSPRKLGPGMAQLAINLDLTSFTLKPYLDYGTVVAGLADASPSTIYRFGQDLVSDTLYWFHWTDDVDVVKGAISGDQTERTYFTHPVDGPRVTNNTLALTGGAGDYPWNSHKLGVPEPILTPSAAVLVAGSGDDEDRVYVFTYVTAFGEEGPPSPPSTALTVKTTGSTTRLSNLGTTAPVGYDNVTAKRIYRTVSGNLSTNFQLVDEIPIAQDIYDDLISNEAVANNELIQTLTYLPPPDSAFGIIQMANGITVLFDGYDVLPSEAYLPYAYPAQYRDAVDFPVVGAAAIGSSAAILTTGNPYLLTGSDPSAMSLNKLDSTQSCASKRSIASVDGGVIYASPDGLMLVTASGEVRNLTEKLFDHKTWQAMLPTTMHGYWHDGKYVGFYGGTGGFIFDPSKGLEASFVMLDFYASAGYTDLLQDALYLKVGTNIVRWQSAGTDMAAKWKSGIAELPKPWNPACAKVRATQYPVTFKLHVDGVLKHTQTVANADPFWLPGGYLGELLQVEMDVTAGEVTVIALADSPQELREA